MLFSLCFYDLHRNINFQVQKTVQACIYLFSAFSRQVLLSPQPPCLKQNMYAE